ncbi:hypothetical protein [Streptomyces spiramyceticus]|uniref:hypothetical protein n=1 Tax=Streptomyces spiramyceticus TaxID=299717 RepID=UPI00237A497C|nr:hypothetical protein [Streptomyces spiramyceticus]
MVVLAVLIPVLMLGMIIALGRYEEFMLTPTKATATVQEKVQEKVQAQIQLKDRDPVGGTIPG